MQSIMYRSFSVAVINNIILHREGTNRGLIFTVTALWRGTARGTAPDQISRIRFLEENTTVYLDWNWVWVDVLLLGSCKV